MGDREVDQQLVERAQRGDKKAFELLVVKYQRKLARLLSRFIRDASEVEDVTQEAFIKAYRALPSFRGDSAFRTWLHRVAINVVRTSHAKQGRLRRLFHDEPPPDPPSGEEPLDAALARRQAIDRALAALPDDLRVAVTLRDLQGLDYKEIAAALDVPVGTVESRIFRARQKLKPLLAGLLGEG